MIKLINILKEIKLIGKITPEMVIKLYREKEKLNLTKPSNLLYKYMEMSSIKSGTPEDVIKKIPQHFLILLYQDLNNLKINEIKLVNSKDPKLVATIEEDDGEVLIVNITSEIFEDLDLYGNIDKPIDPYNIRIEFLFDGGDDENEKQRIKKITGILDKYKYKYEILYPNGAIEEGGDLVLVVVPKKYFKIIR